MDERTRSTTEQGGGGLSIIILGAVLAIAVWTVGVRPFLVSGLSMYPNFNTSFTEKSEKKSLISGDYLVIDIFSYTFLRDPERFDVVVARSPTDNGKHILKRIIGLPGESIRLFGQSVEVTTRDGTTKILNEPYIHRDDALLYKQQIVNLGEDRYFLLGDNRTNSLDSRVWGGLPRERIVGQVILRLYPFDLISVNP